MSHNSTVSHGKSFAIGIALNTAFVVVEAIFGFRSGSSALLADAGHNATDVISLVLAWGASYLATKKASNRYTYGLKKSTILASLINGVLIIGAAGFILYDGIRKIQSPVEVPGSTLMWVAGIGVFINAGTAFLFIKGKDDDLNIKGAFLHMAADAGVTLGVVIAGLLIRNTGYNWIDPVLSFLIVGVILQSAWSLLKDSVNLSIDAVPEDIDIEKLKHFLLGLDGVKEVHDLHVWALSTTRTALTAHLVMPEGGSDEFLFDTRNKLKKEFNIEHCTLQVETSMADEEYRRGEGLQIEK